MRTRVERVGEVAPSAGTAAPAREGSRGRVVAFQTWNELRVCGPLAVRLVVEKTPKRPKLGLVVPFDRSGGQP